jgi:hypothetical protein
VKALVVFTFLLTGLVTGCATITTGTSQSILVDSNPEGAICRFSRSDREVGVVNPTPGMLLINKSGEPLTLICIKDGFYPNSGVLKANMEPMGWGNILVGGLVGIAVDSASGANSKYDASIKVDLRKIEPANLDRVIDDIRQKHSD